MDTVLSASRVSKNQNYEIGKVPVIFNPHNPEHRKEFRRFMASGTRTDARFVLEPGFDTIPGMMLWKMAIHGMGALEREDNNDLQVYGGNVMPFVPNKINYHKR